jgi:hypothetical protein
MGKRKKKQVPLVFLQQTTLSRAEHVITKMDREIEVNGKFEDLVKSNAERLMGPSSTKKDQSNLFLPTLLICKLSR